MAFSFGRGSKVGRIAASCELPAVESASGSFVDRA